MTDRWRQMSVIVSLTTVVAVVVVAAAEEKQFPESGHDILHFVSSKITGQHQQERLKNQLTKGPETLNDWHEEFERTKQKEYSKRKKKMKSKRRRKKLKGRATGFQRRNIPPFIRRVSSMIAKPPEEPLKRVKRAKKSKCGKSYNVRKKSKFRIRISLSETCNIIFRAEKNAAMTLSCKKISVGSCDSAKFLITDGGDIQKTYCGPTTVRKVKLGVMTEILMIYKPSQDPLADVLPPDVTCLVKGRKGRGYKATGSQFCPLTCGKISADAEAGGLPVIGQVIRTTARLSPVSTQPGTVINTNASTANTFLKSSSAAPVTLDSSFTSLSSSESFRSSSRTSLPPSTSSESLKSSSRTSLPPSMSIIPSSATNMFHDNTSVSEMRTNETHRAFSALEGGLHRNSVRVQGGKPAEKGEWAFIVRVLMIFRGISLPCAGTILTPTIIMTAAHCVHDVKLKKKNHNIKVVAYEYNTKIKDETPRQISFVKKIILHPDYQYKTQRADIALLKLKKPLKFGPGVGPVCLAPKGDYVGYPVVILGWGSLSFYGKEPPVLHEATQIVVDVNECAQNYSTLPKNQKDYPVTRDHMCAASPGIDSCDGDSGGPALVQIGTSWYQLGIISFGYKCAIPGFPGVNTLVSSYINWLFSAIKDNDAECR